MGTRTLLASAAGCACLFAAILLGVYYTGAGRWLDNAALDGFLSIIDTGNEMSAARAVASLADPGPYALATIGLVAVALFAGAPRRAAAAAALLAGSAITTQLLKPALAHERLDTTLVGYGHVIDPPEAAAAFPSGHATAAMAIALAAVIVAPRALRALTAAGGALLALGVGFAIVALGWHFPSDIVGGYLVAAAWCLASLAALSAAAKRWPEPGAIRTAARESTPAAAAAVAAVGGAGALGVALASLDRVTGFAAAQTAATVAALGIAAAAATLVAAVSMADRRAAESV